MVTFPSSNLISYPVSRLHDGNLDESLFEQPCGKLCWVQVSKSWEELGRFLQGPKFGTEFALFGELALSVFLALMQA